MRLVQQHDPGMAYNHQVFEMHQQLPACHGLNAGAGNGSGAEVEQLHTALSVITPLRQALIVHARQCKACDQFLGLGSRL